MFPVQVLNGRFNTAIEVPFILQSVIFTISPFSSSVEEAVRKRISKWVQDFYNVLNPGVVNFMINPSFTGNIAFYVNGQYTGQSLPIYEYELDSHGKHIFSFEASGFESKKISYNITPQTGLVREENINLKKNELIKLSQDELSSKLKDNQEALVNLRFQKALQQLDHPQQIRLIRKEIAQVKTAIREFELGKRGN